MNSLIETRCSFSFQALYNSDHQHSYTALAVMSTVACLFFKNALIEIFLQSLKYTMRRWNAWVYLFKGADMVQAAYDKVCISSRTHLYKPMFEPKIDVLQAGSRSFKISGPDNDHIFVTSKESIKEISRAKKDELSLFGATKQVMTSRRSSSNGVV
jgi:hypothetical protein